MRGTGRARLLGAALDIIVEHGLHALTLRAVAQRAGMSLGSTTYHFEDRNRLIEAAVTGFAEDEISRLEEAAARVTPAEGAAAEGADTEDLVRGLFAELERSFATRGMLVAQMELYLEASRNPVLSTLAQRWIAAYEKVIADVMVTAGVPPDQAVGRARRVIVYADGLAVHSVAAGPPPRMPADAASALWALAMTPV